VPPLELPPLVPPLELALPEHVPFVLHVWPARHDSSGWPALAQHTFPIGEQYCAPHCTMPLGQPPAPSPPF
jgi:hypothetical protein